MLSKNNEGSGRKRKADAQRSAASTSVQRWSRATHGRRHDLMDESDVGVGLGWDGPDGAVVVEGRGR